MRQLGLTKQYRLPITFPPVPPGAMEEKNISLMFVNESTECNKLFAYGFTQLGNITTSVSA